MKKTAKTMLSLLLCMVLCLSMLTACGDGDKTVTATTQETTRPAPTKPAPTQPAPTQPAPTQPAPTQPAETTAPAPTETEAEPEIYSVSTYLDNDTCGISLNLYNDYTLIYSDMDCYVEGTYYFADDYFQMTLEDVVYEGYVEDGLLILDDFEGEFYEVEDVGYYPDEPDEPDEPDNPIDPDLFESKKYKELEDSYIRYYDYDSNIAITYPDWMTNLEDSQVPGTVVISAGDYGFVMGLNLTDEYWDYEDTPEDFMMELFNNEIAEAYDEMFDLDWEVDRVTFVPTEFKNQIVAAEANFYSDDYDIMVTAYLYQTVQDGEYTDNVMAKVYFWEYGNEGQLEMLKDEVTKCVSAKR